MSIEQAFVTYLHGKTIGTAEPMATNTIDNDRTGKPLTSAEIEQWQQSMGNKINPEANRIYGEILRNHFQAGSTQTDHIKGIVRAIVHTFACFCIFLHRISESNTSSFHLPLHI